MTFFSDIFRYRDKKSPDKLGLYPQKVHIKPFPERRYLWASRFFVILSGISFCFTMILSATIFLLLPQISAKPLLYQANDTYYTLQKMLPLHVNSSAMDIITEKYINDYITLRHEIPKSPDVLFEHWDEDSLLYQYSTAEVYSEFARKNSKNQILSYIRRGLQRKVIMGKTAKLSGGLWVAEFSTRTITDNLSEPDEIFWKAYLKVAYFGVKDYDDIEKNKDERTNYVLNPMGFKVLKYQTSYAGRPQKALTAMETAKKVFETSVKD